MSVTESLGMSCYVILRTNGSINEDLIWRSGAALQSKDMEFCLNRYRSEQASKIGARRVNASRINSGQFGETLGVALK